MLAIQKFKKGGLNMNFMCAMKNLLDMAIKFSLNITQLSMIFANLFIEIYNGWDTEVCNE